MPPSVQSSVVTIPSDFAQLQSLATSNDIRLYAVLDACDQPLVPLLVKQLEDRAVSLYRGQAEIEHAKIAPYLVTVDARVLDWIHKNLWTQPWGFFATTLADMIKLRTHFRRFLMVEGPDGEELYFRFYDPRVLQPFLESADPRKLARFFDPVQSCFIVNQDVEVLEFQTTETASVTSRSSNKLSFNQVDMDAYANTRRTVFSKLLHRQVSGELIEKGRNFQSVRLREEIDRGILRALTYEMNAQCDIARYVEAMCLYGIGIAGDRDPVPIQDILLDRRVPWSERLDRLKAYCQESNGFAVTEAS